MTTFFDRYREIIPEFSSFQESLRQPLPVHLRVNRFILSHTLNRMGVLNTVATAYRAEMFPLKQRFDYILADVPCSGEGTFRMTHKHSRYREHKGRARLPERQKKILLRAFDLLKESGQLTNPS